MPFSIAPAAPGIFTVTGSQRAVALNQDGSLNSPSNPASRPNVLTVFLTGIGAVDGSLPAGQPAPAAPLLRALALSDATIGGAPAPVLFLGLTPSFIGLAQANLQIPSNIPPGPDAELRIRIGALTSNPALVAVQ
jgi:uncharacterized protein (TIGR03437 family)